MRLTTLLLAPFLALTHAFTLTGLVPPTPQLPNPSTLPATTTFTLSTASSHHRTTIRTDSTFRFHNVPAGSYILETLCPTHHFPSLRVDVAPSGAVSVYQTFRGNPWDNRGPKIEDGLVVVPFGGSAVEGGKKGGRGSARKEYFVIREGFSPVKMVTGNPMVLVALFSLVMVVGVPKVMDKLDPEFKKELEEARKNRNGGPSLLGQLEKNGPQPPSFDLAGYLSGTTSSPVVKNEGGKAAGKKGKK